MAGPRAKSEPVCGVLDRHTIAEAGSPPPHTGLSNTTIVYQQSQVEYGGGRGITTTPHQRKRLYPNVYREDFETEGPDGDELQSELCASDSAVELTLVGFSKTFACLWSFATRISTVQSVDRRKTDCERTLLSGLSLTVNLRGYLNATRI